MPWYVGREPMADACSPRQYFQGAVVADECTVVLPLTGFFASGGEDWEHKIILVFAIAVEDLHDGRFERDNDRMPRLVPLVAYMMTGDVGSAQMGHVYECHPLTIETHQEQVTAEEQMGASTKGQPTYSLYVVGSGSSFFCRHPSCIDILEHMASVTFDNVEHCPKRPHVAGGRVGRNVPFGQPPFVVAYEVGCEIVAAKLLVLVKVQQGVDGGLIVAGCIVLSHGFPSLDDFSCMSEKVWVVF